MKGLFLQSACISECAHPCLFNIHNSFLSVLFIYWFTDAISKRKDKILDSVHRGITVMHAPFHTRGILHCNFLWRNARTGRWWNTRKTEEKKWCLGNLWISEKWEVINIHVHGHRMATRSIPTHNINVMQNENNKCKGRSWLSRWILLLVDYCFHFVLAPICIGAHFHRAKIAHSIDYQFNVYGFR